MERVSLIIIVIINFKKTILKKLIKIKFFCYYSRWTVLTNKHLLTYEEEKIYTNPTEIIDISSIKTVKSDDNPLSFIFVSFNFLKYF